MEEQFQLNNMEEPKEVITIVPDKDFLTITEAARTNGVTRQAIYVAIKQNKLKAHKKSTRWTIHVDDLKSYVRDKYSRSKSIFEGELLFDNQQGFYSVNQVARMLKVPAQKIYYATRIGLLKAIRRGSAWVVHLDDAEEYKKNYIEKKMIKTEVI